MENNLQSDVQNYNHNRPLESFSIELEIIRENGFVPIAVSQIYFEDTFVFETHEEATKAYEMLEEDETLPYRCFGWWYGKQEFLKEVLDYESKEGASKVLIHWL